MRRARWLRQLIDGGRGNDATAHGVSSPPRSPLPVVDPWPTEELAPSSFDPDDPACRVVADLTGRRW